MGCGATPKEPLQSCTALDEEAALRFREKMRRVEARRQPAVGGADGKTGASLKFHIPNVDTLSINSDDADPVPPTISPHPAEPQQGAVSPQQQTSANNNGDGSSSAESAAEPGAFKRAIVHSYHVLRARFHGMNGDVDQFQGEIDASAPKFSEREKRRIHIWLDVVLMAEFPEPLEEHLELAPASLLLGCEKRKQGSFSSKPPMPLPEVVDLHESFSSPNTSFNNASFASSRCAQCSVGTLDSSLLMSPKHSILAATPKGAGTKFVRTPSLLELKPLSDNGHDDSDKRACDAATQAPLAGGGRPQENDVVVQAL